MTSSRYDILESIEAAEANTRGELADWLGMTLGAVGGMIRTLAAEGLIVAHGKRKPPKGPLATVWLITDEGRRVLAERPVRGLTPDQRLARMWMRIEELEARLKVLESHPRLPHWRRDGHFWKRADGDCQVGIGPYDECEMRHYDMTLPYESEEVTRD